MADRTAAERQRRRRQHARGDHRDCLPTHCDQAAGHVPSPPPAPAEPAPRGPRGAALWADPVFKPLGPAHRLLLDEACRIADRLDRLDGLLGKRKSWLTTETDDGGRVVVVVDAVLAEARQHATTLRGLLVEITKALPKPKEAPAAAPKAKGAGIGDLVDFAAAARSRATSG